MTQSSNIRAALIAVVMIALSLWLGVSIITDQVQTLLKVGGAGLLIVCLFLGARIWVLLPIFGAMSIPLIRGFGTAELGQALFIAFAILMFCIRRLPARWRWGALDWWALAVAALIVQVYVRNPAGLNMFGSGSVGGKPYFIVTLAFATMLIFGMMVIRARDTKWVMWGAIIGSFVGGPLGALRRGGVGAESLGIESVPGMTTDTEGAGRKGAFIGPSIVTARLVTAYISPLLGMLRPLWLLLILFSVGAAAFTGYRNTVAMVGLVMLAGIGYHGGVRAMFLSALMGVVGLGVLAGVNLVMPLPATMQRALSPFPGTWEERYVKGADRSTEWRLEMWKAALLTDEWIENKVLGDGLGMSRAEYEKTLDMRYVKGGGTKGASGLLQHQVSALVNGDYHSGPVQTIRTVGYVGLFVFLLAQIAVARSAHRLIMRCKGTEYFPVALFFGIPMVVKPIFFTFIFGEFGTDAASLFMGIAYLKVLHANLPVPLYVKQQRRHYVPLATRRAPSLAHAATRR